MAATTRIAASNAPQSRAGLRRTEIVSAARALYEEKGLARTSIQDIADRVQMTRSLFYHYFKDKDELTSAVMDDMVAEYVEALGYWNDRRQVGEVDDALSSVVKLLRVGIFEKNPLHAALASRENAALYLEFINRVAHHTAAYIMETTVQDYGERHEIRIDHIYETFYMLILGVIGYLRTHPEADDGVVADVIAQTLYLER